MRTKVSSRFGTNVSIKSISFTTSGIHVTPLDVFLLPSNFAPSLIRLIVQFGNHWLKIGCIIKPPSLIHWLLDLRPFDVQFFLLVQIMVRNDALFYFLVFKGHLLYILTNLKNPFPQSFIHFSTTRIFVDLNGIDSWTIFYFWFDMLTFFHQLI